MATIKAYAKVNLCLLIGKKKDGLHKVKSIFSLYKDLYDEIEIKEAKSTKIKYFKNKKELLIQDCIISKAISFLNKKFNLKKEYEITVKKNIPIGSGLGGGSSDAGAVIRYIINKENIPIKNILKESYLIGSDVPFFISNYDLAVVKGFGEKVKKLQVENPEYKVKLNNLSCSTKEVFLKFDELKKTHHMLIFQIRNLVNKKYSKLINDLEKPCFMVYKKLYNIKDEISLSNIVKLSGSGSAFILFKGEKK